MNSQLPVIVAETADKGKGVFARGKFKRGDIVIVGRPIAESPERTWQTLQMEVDTHVRMDKPFELVNHCCDPNCGIRTNEFNGYNLVAMRDIDEQEEITFDYCMSEWISIAVSACHCGSPICRKTITGGKFLSDQILEKYSGFLAPYYEKLRATKN